ncbi:MAG: thiamine-monophosphate kinase [Verrucomicrobiae bacterium]|nr:thiamine-monophosphate kinase [Verrucomicrobiae bacterium]
MERLHDIGEDALIERITAGLSLGSDVVAGAGDDCAVLESADPAVYELLKTDCLVEGVHFAVDSDPEQVGWKALCRSLSDIAAMAGKPRAALVTLAVPGDREVAVVEGWYRGLRLAAERYGVSIVGGETSSLPDKSNAAFLSITLTGSVAREACVLRGGARVGDAIVVTGSLGGSLTSGRHLNFEPRLSEAAWLAANFRPSAMMDLSDGLAKDLPRLAKASGDLGWRIDLESVPVENGCDLAAAIGDGEDYELLFTVSAESVGELRRTWAEAFSGPKLTVIGEITRDMETPLQGGWDHFPNS